MKNSQRSFQSGFPIEEEQILTVSLPSSDTLLPVGKTKSPFGVLKPLLKR